MVIVINFFLGFFDTQLKTPLCLELVSVNT